MSDDQDRKDQEQREAYEKMLQRVTESLEQAGGEARPRLRQALDWAKQKAVEFEELTAEEAERISEYLRRDVEDAARFLDRDNDQDLRGWFRMDMQLLGNWLFDRFSTIADRTRLEWLELNRQWDEAALYHTGEMTGPGELRCLSCSKTMHFERAGHIPPCPSCRATRFERVTD
ncbi:zinc ribbon-containing protein [Aquisalimonas sp. 2447]|uniref:zinc ribbon-containing protein n=1 Tax=Aquisalimonas sp. 2447 TaxID=2740807 RepID=UPI0014323369|nr:zinc ribbon-containing protein [Aquisalimonas sp. 2447]QIT56330.1 zinc ribbon-containing protein [Aquisalimonas sp. 2447]